MDKNKRVLIIDDDPDVLETLQSVLSTRGFTVNTSLDTSNIQNEIESFCPDVLLLDVNLKNANGGEICRELKKCGTARNISIILFSGDRSIKEQYKNYLADNFIEKPVSISNLVTSLKQSSVKTL